MGQETDSTDVSQKLGYGPLASLLVTISSYFVGQIIGFIIFIFVLTVYNTAKIGWVNLHFFGHLLKLNANTATTLTLSPRLTFFQIFSIEAVTLGVVFRFLHTRKTTLKTIGLNYPNFKYILYAVVGAVAYFAIYIIGIIIAKQLIPSLDLDQKQELGFNAVTHGSALWWVFFSLVILPPFVEELVMRGFLFTGLRTKLSFTWAAIVVSTLFAAAHLGEGSGDGLLWVAGIDTFILSIVLCFLREKTKSLWPSIGVHMIKNGLAFVLIFKIFQ